MSAGVSALSDAELMRQLGASGFGGSAPAAPPRAPAPAPSGVSALSDAELLRQLGASQGGRSGAASSTANPFDQGGQASIADRFSGPMASTLERDATGDLANLGTQLRRVADEKLVGKPDATSGAAAFLLRGGNALGLNLPRNAAAAISTLPGVGNGQTFSQNYQLAKDQEEALARLNPKSALAGTVTGIGAGAVALPGFGGGASLGSQAVAGLKTGAAYGFGGELFDSKDWGEAAKAGAIGGAIGGAAAPVVTYAVRGAQALAPWMSKGVSFTNSRGEYTPEAKAALGRAGVHPDLLPPRQAEQAMRGLDQSIADTFSAKGVSDAAAREAVAGEFAIPLSRGQATGDRVAQEFEAAAGAGARGKRALAEAQDFQARQAEAINAAQQRIDAAAGRGVRLDAGQQASEVIADQAREYARRSAAEVAAAQQAGDDVLARLRGPSPVDQLDAGSVVTQGLRDAAGASKGRYRAAYDDVAQIPGEFAPGALDRLGASVRARLGVDVPVDEVTTPAANRFLRDLDNLPGLFGTDPGTGPTLQQMDQLRKRLSIYARGSSQNPTDQRALSAIRSAFDDHVFSAVDAGLFGPRQAARIADDGFPGAAALDALPTPAAAADGPSGAPESLLQYISRNGGIPLDGDTRASDLNRLYRPGSGTLARRDAPTWDQWRVRLAEEGFLPYDEAMAASPRDVQDLVLNAIQAERQGQPRYRLAETRTAPRAAERVSDENAAYADQLDDYAGQISAALGDAGIRGRDIDPDTLRSAAELLSRRRYDDLTEAYEAAVMAREPAARAPRIEDVPFDGPTAVAATDALPGAVPDVVEKMRQARALFSEYKRTFAPQGAGDDVGLAMRKIVDRNADPAETAQILYAGSPGRNIRMAERVKAIVGGDSPTWAAHQQGFISSVVNGRDMRPEAVSRRILDALDGQKRGVASAILNDEQVAGLREFQKAALNSRIRGEQVPEWISTLSRSDFDPNRITAELFGSGIPGSRPGSAAYAGALKKFVGEDSAEWSGLRQAAWRRLTGSDDGVTLGVSPKDLADRITKFANGSGATLAKAMFGPEEIAEMRRLSVALKLTAAPDGISVPKGESVMSRAASHALNALAVSIGLKVGGFPGAGAAAGLRLGQRVVGEGLTGRRAARSFREGAPALPAPGPVLDLAPLGIGAGGVAQYGYGAQ